MTDTSLPELVLYGKPGCGLCDESRELLETLLARRAADGLPAPTLVERDILADPALRDAYGSTIPVLEYGGSAARARDRRRRAAALPRRDPRRPRCRGGAMSGDDITILVALFAGVISFLSPCVLPIVPAYIGQLTAIAVAASADGRQPSRWLALRHATAFVLGFGVGVHDPRPDRHLRRRSPLRLPALAPTGRRASS